MFRKKPYARFTLLHRPSGRHLVDVPQKSFDAIMSRIESLRQANTDMSEYRVVKRIIRSETKSEGRIRRTYFPRESKTYAVDMLEAMQRLGMVA